MLHMVLRDSCREYGVDGKVLFEFGEAGLYPNRVSSASADKLCSSITPDLGPRVELVLLQSYAESHTIHGED